LNEQLIKLKNQLCFPLYAVAKEVVSLYKPYLDEINLTYTQYIAMMVIWEHKTVGVKELGEHLYLDSGTLTPLLKRLESKGFIRRERSAEDERAVNITITEVGEELKEKAALVPLKMRDCISLDPDDAQTLYALLYKLLGQINHRGEK
jgi:DNA-binding MarR family transcriptional regulator